MTPFERALAEFSSGPRQALADAHLAAIASGGNFTGTSYETECTLTAQDLLCLAGNAAVELAMLAQIFDAAPADEPRRALKTVAAGIARLTARSLEVHARDTGYEPGVWISSAVDETELTMLADCDELFDGLIEASPAVCLSRRAAAGIHAALACAPVDRMGVPGHIATALGAAVAMFMVADDAQGDE